MKNYIYHILDNQNNHVSQHCYSLKEARVALKVRGGI